MVKINGCNYVKFWVFYYICCIKFFIKFNFKYYKVYIFFFKKFKINGSYNFKFCGM